MGTFGSGSRQHAEKSLVWQKAAVKQMTIAVIGPREAVLLDEAADGMVLLDFNRVYGYSH